MKSLKGVIVLVLIVAVLGVVILERNAFNTAYHETKLFLAGLTGGPVDHSEYSKLVRENQHLKFELSKIKEESNKEIKEGKTANVYSRYPFNDKERITINLGKDDRVSEGNPVVTKDGFLLGKISSVKGGQAEVTTIFDPEWKSSVAVDDAENKAVIKGGQPPKIELLPKKANVGEGDSVFNVAPDYPYEKLIGSIKGIKDISNEIWRTAVVDIPYNIDEINEVIVLTEFSE